MATKPIKPAAIPAVPTPVPSRTDRANFAARGDAMMTWFDPGVSAINDSVGFVDEVADFVEASAIAANSTGPEWVSGTTYVKGFAVFSPIDFQTYRRKVAGAGTIDPSSDSSNWRALTPGRLLGIQKFNAAGTFVYTKTPGTNFIRVRAVGGGASGSGIPASGAGILSFSSGGGAGSPAEAAYDASAITSVVVTIGAGGVSGINSAQGGGATSFGAWLTCPGGGQGSVVQIGTGNVAQFSAQSLASAMPSGSGILWAARGQWGFPGQGFGTAGVSYGGQGGASVFGSGGGNTTGGGNPGLAPGAGGSGAANTPSSAGVAGGNGADGYMIIEEFA